MDTVDIILALIKSKGIEQRELSNYLGLSHNTVTGWKKGTTKSYLRYIDKIADYFGVSTDYLLNKENKSINHVEDTSYLQLIKSIEALMFKANIKTFAEFERLCGLSHGTIRKWKTGEYKPTVKNLDKISSYFNVSIDYLLRQEDTSLNNKDGVSSIYIAGSDGTHKFSSMDKEKVSSFLAKHPVQPVRSPLIQEPIDHEVIDLWIQLTPIEQAELKGQMKGFIKSRERNK